MDSFLVSFLYQQRMQGITALQHDQHQIPT